MIDFADDEALLDRFRQWLREARAEAETPRDGFSGAFSDGQTNDRSIGLYRLAEELTALRHELRLQTKSARGLQEQAETLLPAFRQAMEQFRAVEPKEAQAAWLAGRPLALALAELDEALDRGLVEIEKARGPLVEEPARALEAGLDGLFARQSWLRRRSCRAYHEEARRLVGRDLERRRGLFDALLEGYRLIQARLGRTLKSEKIERINAVGRPVEPERMEVVEAVDDPSIPAGHVVDEIRRGYTWQGRLLRPAEVRASRSSPAPLPIFDELLQPGDDQDLDESLELPEDQLPSSIISNEQEE